MFGLVAACHKVHVHVLSLLSSLSLLSLAFAITTADASPDLPELRVTSLEIKHRGNEAIPKMDKIIRVALPKDWTGDIEASKRSILLFGPKGEGEIFVGVVSHPSQLGVFLQRLKKRHPSSVPSPPSAIDVPGIRPHKGERATRFEVTGRELGEIVTIERGEVIVMIATIVQPNAWASLAPIMKTTYPSIRVHDREVDAKK